MATKKRKGMSGIGGSFYVHRNKPDFCELFIICGGKSVSLRDANDQGFMEVEEGAVVDDVKKKMKEKNSFRGWLEKILPNHSSNNMGSNSERGSPHSQSFSAQEKWENCVEEIENYIKWLNLNSTNEEIGEEHASLQLGSMDQKELEEKDPNTGTPQKIEALKDKIEETKKIAEEKRYEAKISIERRKRAEWVISMCNRRDQELEAQVHEEMTKQLDLKKELDSIKEQIEETSHDVLESKNKLKSALELEGELKNILQVHHSERLQIEAQLEKVVSMRGENLREIDEIRRQRDVFRRRIDFCREREAIAMSNGVKYGYREFTMDELRQATDNFSELMQVAGGPSGAIYKGKLNHALVSIKMQYSWNMLSLEEFQAKVNLIRQIRHPHIITAVGACRSDPKAIIFEYAHNRSLQDVLFSKNPNPNNRRSRNPRTRRRRSSILLPWHDRIRIASEVCSAIAFLHSTKPWPTPHGRIQPSNVLLDHILVAKVADFGSDGGNLDVDVAMKMDICDLGILMLQMLIGREDVVGLVGRDGGAFVEGWPVDDKAGEWPVDVEVGFGELGARCAEVGRSWGPVTDEEEMGMDVVLREMEELRRMATVWMEKRRDVGDGGDEMDGRDVPEVFLCPILQEVMKQPYIAADGFSYEFEAIEEWLKSGHDTSPMTNLKLKNTRLIPNHTLRSLIADWQHNN